MVKLHQLLQPQQIGTGRVGALVLQGHVGQQRVGHQTVGHFFYNTQTALVDLKPLIGVPQGFYQQKLQVNPFRLCLKQLAQFGNGLLIQLTFEV